jgi:hypothetical protein
MCIFCNEGLINKSREHVFPLWLLKYLSIEGVIISPTHSDKITGDTKSKRRHDLSNFVSGGICEQCNNGWMSDLENAAKPILIDLIDLKKETKDLSRDERMVISRWATKTIYVLNLASNYFKNIPIHHFKYIKDFEDSLPSGIIVLAQQHHSSEKFYWLQSATWVINSYDDFSIYQKPLSEESYKISIQLGNLILLVAYNPIEDLAYSIWRGIHVPFYPKSGQIGSYEKEEFPWDNSISAIAAFHMGLQLINKSSL